MELTLKILQLSERAALGFAVRLVAFRGALGARLLCGIALPVVAVLPSAAVPPVPISSCTQQQCENLSSHARVCTAAPLQTIVGVVLLTLCVVLLPILLVVCVSSLLHHGAVLESVCKC
jgi:tellurite resistance protein TehA-like permease